MPRIKEWWRGLSKKWRLVIIIVPVMVVLGGMGSVAVVLEYTGYSGENPRSCSTCHFIQPYVDSYYGSNLLDNAHARADSPVKCKDCHYATLVQLIKMGKAFVTGNYETPLEQRVQTQKFCTGCHPVEEITVAVRNRPEYAENHLLSYHLTGEASARSCIGSASAAKCQDCHRVHRVGVNYCATCHSVSFSAPSK